MQLGTDPSPPCRRGHGEFHELEVSAYPVGAPVSECREHQVGPVLAGLTGVTPTESPHDPAVDGRGQAVTRPRSVPIPDLLSQRCGSCHPKTAWYSDQTACRWACAPTLSNRSMVSTSRLWLQRRAQTHDSWHPGTGSDILGRAVIHDCDRHGDSCRGADCRDSDDDEAANQHDCSLFSTERQMHGRRPMFPTGAQRAPG